MQFPIKAFTYNAEMKEFSQYLSILKRDFQWPVNYHKKLILYGESDTINQKEIGIFGYPNYLKDENGNLRAMKFSNDTRHSLVVWIDSDDPE